MNSADGSQHHLSAKLGLCAFAGLERGDDDGYYSIISTYILADAAERRTNDRRLQPNDIFRPSFDAQ